MMCFFGGLCCVNERVIHNGLYVLYFRIFYPSFTYVTHIVTITHRYVYRYVFSAQS